MVVSREFLEHTSEYWEQRYKKAMLALESLTPSGSEYVGDIERCVAHVRDSQTTMLAAMVNFKNQRDEKDVEINRLKEQLAAYIKFHDRIVRIVEAE